MLSSSCSLILWYRVTANSSASCRFQLKQRQLEISHHSSWSDEKAPWHTLSQELCVFNQLPQRVMAEVTGISPVFFPISIFNSHFENCSCSMELLIKSCIRIHQAFLNYSRLLTVSWLLRLSNGNKCKYCTLCHSNSCEQFSILIIPGLLQRFQYV